LAVPCSTVRYEAAGTLVYISNHASAIKAAANCYIELAIKESDNNVKLIVLDKIHQLHLKNERMLDDSVMDILRVASSPDLSVRRKCLNIAMELLSTRNVEQVVEFLKNQLQKTTTDSFEKNQEYRQILATSVHSCAIKFPAVADSVISVLLDFLTDDNKMTQIDVIAFVKEVIERFPNLRDSILSSLLDSFPDIKASNTIRGALWIIGEYTNNVESKTKVDSSDSIRYG
jgi:coatomer subunit beta